METFALVNDNKSHNATGFEYLTDESGADNNGPSRVSWQPDTLSIEQLAKSSSEWNATVYKTSNEMLYNILQGCYEYYQGMCANTSVGKFLREELAAYIDRHGLRFTQKTHSLTKIVKCVFGAERRRVSAYSIALRAAHAKGITAEGLADFITQSGGVEELRAPKSSQTLTTQQRAERAQVAVQDQVLATINCEAIAQQLDMAAIGQQLVLVAAQLPNGELAIKCWAQSKAAVNAALSCYYSSISKTLANEAETKEIISDIDAITSAVEKAKSNAGNEMPIAA